MARIAKALGGFGRAPAVQPLPGINRWRNPTNRRPTTPTGPSFTPGTPAPAQAAPAEQGPTGPPIDPAYEAQLAAYQRNTNDTLAGLSQQRYAGLSDFGYNAQTDAQGNATGVSFDPNNPYSQAARLRKHYQQSKTGTTNRAASRGQIFSGSYLTAQNADDQNYNQGEDRLQKALLSFLARNQMAQRSTRNQYETSAAQALAERLARAQQGM